MATNVLNPKNVQQLPEIECGHCQGKLPLRMSRQGERGAVWLCATCSIPFVSICIKDSLTESASNIRLDERYFDTKGLPPISQKLRREVAELAKHCADVTEDNHRRSDRISQSLVVSGVKLDSSFNPLGRSFQLMVANVSREGIGLVYNAPIESEYIAIELPKDNEQPIQVVVRLIRERQLKSPFWEIGGEFFVRLGSVSK